MNYAIDHCEPFDGRTENPWMKAEHVGRYLFCVDFFKSIHAHKLMDAACAEGFGSQLLAESGFSVYGADINPNYVETAGKRCAGCFTVMDFERQDFPSEFAEMDGAVCFETIEHIREGGVLLKKLSRCIRDGSYLLLSFPNSLFKKSTEMGSISTLFTCVFFLGRRCCGLPLRQDLCWRRNTGRASVTSFMLRKAVPDIPDG